MEQELKAYDQGFLLPDEPIKSLGQDWLDRKYFAEHSLETIVLEVRLQMIGAIAGDIIGSVFEFDPIKSTDFPLFSAHSNL